MCSENQVGAASSSEPKDSSCTHVNALNMGVCGYSAGKRLVRLAKILVLILGSVKKFLRHLKDSKKCESGTGDSGS